MQQQSAPLSEGERAELEALRAEKARREKERAQRERAELEALRAELADEGVAEAPASAVTAAADKPSCAPHSASAVDAAPGASSMASRPDEPGSVSRSASPEPSPRPAEEPSFAVRMVSTVPAEDEGGVPGMAPVQKVLIAVAALALVGFIVYMALGGS